jgi:hypothetical protein
MKTIRVKGLRGLSSALKKMAREKEKLLDQAARKAAQRHRSYIAATMPVAFGELRASVRVEGTRVVVDAPYAAAVERGSRPHWMPLEPLIKWVKLRGFQGLASAKSQARLPGNTTMRHATNVAAQLADHRRGGSGFAGPETAFSAWSHPEGGEEDSAARDVAKAIQLAIALKGTKPTWFMRDSIPKAQAFLREEVHAALAKG